MLVVLQRGSHLTFVMGKIGRFKNMHGMVVNLPWCVGYGRRKGCAQLFAWTFLLADEYGSTYTGSVEALCLLRDLPTRVLLLHGHSLTVDIWFLIQNFSRVVTAVFYSTYCPVSANQSTQRLGNPRR